MAREAREIAEVNQLNQIKKSSEVKTHDEILGLLKEVESIEDKLKSTETTLETVDEPVFIEVEQAEMTGEIEKEIQFIEVPTESKTKEKVQTQETEKQKRKIHFMFKSRRKKKPKGELEPGNSTFTLRIDDQSNLVGFNIKKPKPQVKSKHRRFLPFKRGFSKGSEDEKTTEESGIKGKIKGIFSRLKSKASGEEGGSKISNILGKIKGIFSRS